MQTEFNTVSLPLDENLQNELQTLAAQGWNLIPGYKPVGVYALFRMVAPDAQALIKMGIDESKMSIVGSDGQPKQ